ncbi:Matrix-remodeling-associated protein 8, partial [Lamprotornis superbus]
VAESDEGTYSCNLHHHYCHLYETVKIQLLVAKREANRAVQLQLLHGFFNDSQDRADRLVDLYASGERRSYGPHFVRQKMNVSRGAFAAGDFSLRISHLESADEGTYSCHLHHHYCGLHERRIYHLAVLEPQRDSKVVNITSKGIAPAADPNVVRGHNVINVIIPESRMHFFQQLGYILATLLLFLVLLIIVVLITRRRRQRGYEYNVKKYGEKDVNLKEFTVDTTDLTPHKSEDIRLDYKNNILKEKAEQARSFPAKNIDLDKGEELSPPKWQCKTSFDQGG